MEVSGYLAVARRWWWVLLVATWVAALVGYMVASQIPPTYEARVQLLVGPYNTDSDTLRAAGQLVQTYGELVTTEPLLASAIAEVGADMVPPQLDASTRVVANDTTRFLTIRVQNTDPVLARDLANALANEITLLASRGTSRPEGQLQIVDFARTPVVPIAPQVSLIVVMAALAALIGAMVIVLLVEYLSATVRTKDDLAKLTDLPYLGSVDTLRTPPTSQAGLIDRAPESAAAAAYRLVAAKVASRETGQAARSIIVVGTAQNGFAAQVAANLAAIVARGGRQVILVDADGAESLVTKTFGLGWRPGLADVAADASRPITNGLIWINRTLRVMPRGSTGAVDAIDPETAERILANLQAEADLVVVSTGPLHLSAAAVAWTRAGEASILVAVRDQTRRDDLSYAIEGLRLVGVAASGIVLAERRRSMGRGITPAARTGTPETHHADAGAESAATDPRAPVVVTSAGRSMPGTVATQTSTGRGDPTGPTGS